MAPKRARNAQDSSGTSEMEAFLMSLDESLKDNCPTCALHMEITAVGRAPEMTQ